MSVYAGEGWKLVHGNCLEVLRALPSDSISAVVTDPPYGLSNTDPKHVVETLTRWASGDREYVPEGAGFMGKEWDAFVPPPAVWDEAFRVLKPGGHLLCFAGSRTFDLMTLSIRFSGFEIRDSIAWLYGSGFPKSMDVSKAIDKQAGAQREVVGRRTDGRYAYEFNGTANRPTGAAAGSEDAERIGGFVSDKASITAPSTPEAEQWQGWGTALKPAFEPIIMARKPIGEKTVAANVIAHGTGALHIDATRVGDGPSPSAAMRASGRTPSPLDDDEKAAVSSARGRLKDRSSPEAWAAPKAGEQLGRWPANVVFDEPMAEVLDEQTGTLAGGAGNTRRKDHATDAMAGTLGREEVSYGDKGGASRFFYVAKAPKKERPTYGEEDKKVAHPTVKPLALMRWLVRLVTPPEGIVLDPFAGSGTTMEAARQEGFSVIGIELTEDYVPLIQQRMDRVVPVDT